MSVFSLSKIKDPVKSLINLNIPVMLWGPTGLGKSSLIKEIAKDLNRPVIDIRLSQVEFSDLRGIPYISKDQKVLWSIPSFFPTDPNDDSIIFLDEINTAHSSVLSAAYQLILDRQIGEYILPPKVSLVAAGNRTEDNDELTEIPRPLLNRFCHFEVKYNFDSWFEHAKNNHNKYVLDYLSSNKSELFDLSPNTRAFNTPRSWERVSQIMSSFPSEISSSLTILQPLIESCIGEPAAIKFMSFLKKKNKISINFEKILTDPEYRIKEKISYDTFEYLKTGIFESLDSKFGESLSKIKTLSIPEKTQIYTQIDNSLRFIKDHCDDELWVTFLHFLTKECKISFIDSFMPNYKDISRSSEIKEIVSKLL